jgi:hypothetical protein
MIFVRNNKVRVGLLKVCLVLDAIFGLHSVPPNIADSKMNHCQPLYRVRVVAVSFVVSSQSNLDQSALSLQFLAVSLKLLSRRRLMSWTLQPTNKNVSDTSKLNPSCIDLNILSANYATLWQGFLPGVLPSVQMYVITLCYPSWCHIDSIG